MKDDFKNAKTIKRKKDTKLGLVDLIHGDFHDLQSVGVRFGGVVFPRSLIGWFSLAAVQGMDGKGPR